MFQLKYGVCELLRSTYLRYGCWYLRVVPQVLWWAVRACSIFIPHERYRPWLPWVLPGSTGRFKKDDVVHYHSAHGCYITRMKGGVRYAWYCCYILTRIQQNWAKTAIHIIRELDLVTFHMKDIWVMRRAKSIYVYDVKTQKLQVRGTPCKWWSRSQQRSSPGVQLRLTPLLVLIERVWWISHSLITLITSSAVDMWRQSTFHTPVVEEVAGLRDIRQAALTAILPSGVLR